MNGMSKKEKKIIKNLRKHGFPYTSKKLYMVSSNENLQELLMQIFFQSKYKKHHWPKEGPFSDYIAFVCQRGEE